MRSKDDPGPAVDLNLKTSDRIVRHAVEAERETVRLNRQPSGITNLESTQKKRREGDYVTQSPGPSPQHAEPEPKRRRLSPEEVVQSPSSGASRHAVDNAGSQVAAANFNSGSKDNTTISPQAPVDRRDRSLNIFRSPAVSSGPVASRDGICHGSSPRTQNLVKPHEQPGLVVDSESESESRNRFDRGNDAIHAGTSQSASSKMTLDARIANIESFNYGIVSEEDLGVTSDRLTLGKRFNCSGNGSVVYSREGTHYLFPSRNQHPYAPAMRGMPGLFFSPKLDRKLSRAHEVIVGISLESTSTWASMGSSQRTPFHLGSSNRYHAGQRRSGLPASRSRRSTGRFGVASARGDRTMSTWTRTTLLEPMRGVKRSCTSGG